MALWKNVRGGDHWGGNRSHCGGNCSITKCTLFKFYKSENLMYKLQVANYRPQEGECNKVVKNSLLAIVVELPSSICALDFGENKFLTGENWKNKQIK